MKITYKQISEAIAAGYNITVTINGEAYELTEEAGARRNEIITNAEAVEKFENMISYYNYHGIENMIEKRPEFVAEDFGEVLNILESILGV